MNELEKAHKRLWELSAELEAAQSALARQKGEHAQAIVAGQKPDDGKLRSAIAKVESLELGLGVALERQGEALRQHLDAERQKTQAELTQAQKRQAALQQKYAEAFAAVNQAGFNLQEIERLISSLVIRTVVPRQAQTVLLGSIEAVRQQAKSDPMIIINPMALESALAGLEAQLDRDGFGPGRGKIGQQDDIVYRPAIGSVRIDLTPDGAIRLARIERVMARSESGELVTQETLALAGMIRSP